MTSLEASYLTSSVLIPPPLGINVRLSFVFAPQGLKYRRNVAGKTAVFNGEEVILEETDWYLLDLFRLWWRYGISFIRLQMWVEEIMEKFMR